MTMREMSFRDLAEREVPGKRWGGENWGLHQQELFQVFQVEFDYDGDGYGPSLFRRPDVFDCRDCASQGRNARPCPHQQFAIDESQLLKLWRNWNLRMYPINPIDHEEDDGWDLPGSSAYFEFFGK